MHRWGPRWPLWLAEAVGNKLEAVSEAVQEAFDPLKKHLELLTWSDVAILGRARGRLAPRGESRLLDGASDR